MTGQAIHVLSIEDNPADAMLVKDKLAEAERVGWDLPRFEVEHVARLEAALERLEDDGVDVVLSDLDLPDSRADETIATLRKHIPSMPIVVLTGREDEALARKSVRAGVQDYLYKNEATGSLLARTMMYAIERQENRRALQEARDALERRVDERTKELRQLNRELRLEVIERKRTEKALRESRERYRSLFNETPISIWEEDFSDVRAYLDDLRASGVEDFAAYFQNHPEAVVHCAGLVRIIDVNEAALVLRGAGSKDDLPNGLDVFLTEEGYPGFRKQLARIAEGETRVEVSTVNRTLTGDKRYLIITWRVAPGHEETLSRCIVSIQDITDRKRMEEALQESESRIRHKLQSILSPDSDLGELELSDIIDVEAIQALMDDFYELTDIGIAIVNLKGEVLVATGWQDICTQFHRVHPETLQHCIESDTVLSSGVEPGTYKLYKCKNNMWDMATPIVVGGRHVGNLFLGQFFFADEAVDREVFRQQARKYGFDEEAYLAALDRVPRWSRERVETVFRFYTRFATMISQLSHSNLKLAQALTEKDRLLTAHRESERKFKSYIEHAPYGIFVSDEEGRYVEVNEAACRMTGYDRDELLNRRIVELAPPDHRDVVEEHFQTAIEEGGAVSEEPFVTKEGHTRWWSVTTVRLSDTRLLGYKEDITRRKQAEEAQRLYQYRLKALLDLSQMRETPLEQIADFVLDKAVHLTESEIGFLGFIGEDEEEMVVHAWSSEAMAGCQVDDQPRHFPIDSGGVWAEAIRQGRPLMLNQYAAPHPGKKGYPDGHVLLTRLLSVPIFAGERVEAIVAVANKKADYDQTDLRQVQLLAEGMLRLIRERQAQEALRESEERYRSLYRSIRDAILVANTDREVVNCNPAFTELFGYTLNEIRGKKTRYIYENEGEFRQMGEALEEHRGDPSFFFTMNYRKKSGEVFPGETNLFYLRDDAGEIVGFIGLIRDVTQRRQAEARIASYAAELERSNRELEQFAYAVSHDLQAPLRMSTSYLHLLKEQCGDQIDAQATSYIDSAVDGAERMKAMIQALLDLSRVGTRGEAFGPTDCESVLRQTLNDLSLTMEESNAQVTHAPLPTVMADEAQLAQVFQNLISNAIKFRKEDEPPRVHVSAERVDDEWVFSVSDNGIGIDPEQAERAFQVFQRLHTEEEYPGLGMGLALCKRIVERHDGSIWVESEPGEGSTFRFTLPAQ